MPVSDFLIFIQIYQTVCKERICSEGSILRFCPFVSRSAQNLCLGVVDEIMGCFTYK